MSTMRSVRAWTATLVAVCILFAQVAVSAYACPQLLEQSTPVAQGKALPMVDCDSMPAGEMDPTQPNLCKAHCEFGQQVSKADNYPDTPSPELNVLWPLVWVLLPTPQTASVVSPAAETSERPRGSPPLYIVHQVFRL